LGKLFQLVPIWAKYHVYAGLAGEGGQLAHTAGIYLIDQRGRERVFLDATSAPATILTDVRGLVTQE
jgi:cytochrome oxidase Cu insertion factor (SCO1/SenC/PrrC family)